MAMKDGLAPRTPKEEGWLLPRTSTIANDVIACGKRCMLDRAVSLPLLRSRRLPSKARCTQKLQYSRSNTFETWTYDSRPKSIKNHMILLDLLKLKPNERIP